MITDPVGGSLGVRDPTCITYTYRYVLHTRNNNDRRTACDPSKNISGRVYRFVFFFSPPSAVKKNTVIVVVVVGR